MNRLSNLSVGTLIAICTFGGLAIVIAFGGQQMFSPGPLSTENRRNITRGDVKSHAQIGSNCAACHASPWGSATMAERCLDCHTDIRVAIDKKQAMHGLLQDAMQCRNCHTEHQGLHGILTMSLDQFDHNCAAFKLTGKHTAVDCASCHRNQLYKGTPTNCLACHAEPTKHKGRFGTDCASCHSTNNWTTDKIGLFANFDHYQTAFKLTGKHKSVACASCHVNNVFKGTSTTCVSCHAEPKTHKGEFGLNCASCHSTDTWSGASFRHSFPVNHANATKKGGCAICHTTANDFQAYTCYGCHRHEPNNTAKKHLKYGVKDVKSCALCHPAGRKKKLAFEEGPSLDICLGQSDGCGLGTLGRMHASLPDQQWVARGSRGDSLISLFTPQVDSRKSPQGAVIHPGKLAAEPTGTSLLDRKLQERWSISFWLNSPLQRANLNMIHLH